MNGTFQQTPAEAREVVLCGNCHLTQYRTVSNFCRRCRKSLNGDEPEIASSVVPATPQTPFVAAQRPDIGFAVRLIRQARGLSQAQLAAKMGVFRSYISKIERRYDAPTISSVYRFAEALEVSPPVLMAFATFHIHLRR